VVDLVDYRALKSPRSPNPPHVLQMDRTITRSRITVHTSNVPGARSPGRLPYPASTRPPTMSDVTIAEAWPPAGRPFTVAELDRMPYPLGPLRSRPRKLPCGATGTHK
jgi:hypothetical protein